MWSVTGVVVLTALFAVTLSSEPVLPITYLPPQRYDTTLDGEVTATINLVGYKDKNVCKLQSPEGNVYDLSQELPEGISVFTSDAVSCGITMKVISARYVGEWTLIAVETVFDIPNEERRMKFTVYVEESVNASPRDKAIVAEGNNFYLHLENPVDSNVNCHVEGPNADRMEVDTRLNDNCAFVLKNAKESDSGTWKIVYGDDIVYKATVQLTVSPTIPSNEVVTELALTRDRSVNQILGPDDAVYCILQEPSGFAVYDGFGQCHLTLDRVTMEHHGVWSLRATHPGKILTNQYEIRITVEEADPKPTVAVNVQMQQPAVFLSCAVSTSQEFRSCKFRDPSGQILIASSGVGEDRYAFFGKGTTLNNGVYTHDCGLQITSPENSDLGLWRCAIDTDHDTYFGFLTVLFPWAMNDPNVAAAVVTKPILTADKKNLSAFDGEKVTMSCKIQTPIRYCYFRAMNGTIFSVGPETSTDKYSYSGAGFDAGECGITFKSINYNDGGSWSCHVGFLDSTEMEQKEELGISVFDQLAVDQYPESSERLMVVAHAHEQRALDYCRFVRIDGLGFTEATPDDAKTLNELSKGICRLRIKNPSVLDHHPWTVVAKIAGHPEEITGVTRHTIGSDVPNPHPQEKPENGNESADGEVIYYVQSHSMIFLVSFLIMLPLIIVALLMIKKSNRDWAHNKYGHARNSFRRAFRRETVLVEDLSTRKYPDAVIYDNELPKKVPLA